MTKLVECPKCSGKGYIVGFGHIENGTCFKCGGKGQIPYRKPRAIKDTYDAEYAAKQSEINRRIIELMGDTPQIQAVDQMYKANLAREIYAKYLQGYGINVYSGSLEIGEYI